ncbi:MAG: BrnT family toxin [Caulobacterales bacterium]|nr:BrnT family toxin [Caulobacterales bacterium]
MEFEWDAAKARANWLKHGVTFELATGIWNDPGIRFVLDAVIDGEERWWAVGRASVGGLLIAVHVYPNPDQDNLIRLISARRASRHERRRYEDGSL